LGELHPLAKLTDERVREILTTGEEAAALAERFGVAETTIRVVRAGRR